MGSPAIETTGLSKRFGRVTAVEDLSLVVPAGTVYGLLGPNGAGKTTTLRLLVGLLRADSGSVTLLGRPVHPRDGLGDGVGALVDRPSFYPYLNAIDNLRLFALARGMSSQLVGRSVVDALRLVGLKDSATRRVAGFSTGMKQRLGIALALLGAPTLVLLDEPVNGLDPEGIAEMREVFRQLSADGVTILLSSHLLAEVELVCREVGIINQGRLISSGPITGLMDSAGLRVVFRAPSDKARASAILEEHGFQVQVDPLSDISVIVVGRQGEEVVAALGTAGLYPAEVRASGTTLEEGFLRVLHEDRNRSGLEEVVR